MENIAADYDGPWKQALMDYFPACMEFFYPAAYADIDWDRGYEILNTELQKIVPEAKVGRRVADILVQVYRKNGSPINVLVHVEVQTEYEVDFPKRIHTYESLIELRHDAPVASLVIFGDDRPKWRPKKHVSKIWENKTIRSYRVVKLLDYQNKWSELERSTNPFAVMVMAHLKTMATRQDAQKRLEWKTRVTKGLLSAGYSEKEIRSLLRLVYWMMRLPEGLEREFQIQLDQFLEEKEMPYVMMPCEQDAMERGLSQGLEQGLERGSLLSRREDIIDILVLKFSEVPSEIADRINKLSDASVLRELLQRSVTIASLSDFSEVLDRLVVTTAEDSSSEQYN
ncbi:MAG: transposase [Hormoscilla sp.]